MADSTRRHPSLYRALQSAPCNESVSFGAEIAPKTLPATSGASRDVFGQCGFWLGIVLFTDKKGGTDEFVFKKV